jgi:site-specific DNA-adenine methylase
LPLRRPDTFFYLEPPYYPRNGSTSATTPSHHRHEDLAADLKGIRGKFLLRTTTTVRAAIYADATIDEVEATYSVSGISNAGPNC